MLLLLLALLTGAGWAEAPGVATPVEDPGHAGLSAWFRALSAAARGRGVARALHYGDSTLAADNLARTVRTRLQARFGDAGPGFVPASFQPAWSVRADAVATRAGDWRWLTILNGGAGGRYGLGGIVGLLSPGASVTVRAVGLAGETRRQRHVEVWYQAGVGYGTVDLHLDGAPVAREPAVAPATEDQALVLDRAEGFERVRVAAVAGTVPLYGIVLESGEPGATWETLAVKGVGSRSFTRHAGEGLGPPVTRRRPDLLVVMLGGNEAGFPALTRGEGEGYAPVFQGAPDVIRAGTPEASCLVVSPLDQGKTTEDGVRRSKPGMANLVARQREVALASGCAFWSAREAMGGEGAAVAWTRYKGLTSGDLLHLTRRGLEVVGNLLADALLADYDAWAADRASAFSPPSPAAGGSP